LLAAVPLAGLTAGCTVRSQLYTGSTPAFPFTVAWAGTDIAAVPAGADPRFRYELHNQPDAVGALGDPPGLRRSGYVVAYDTRQHRSQVLIRYRQRYGTTWHLHPVAGNPNRLTGYRGGLRVEVRLHRLPDGPRNLLHTHTEVLTLVTGCPVPTPATPPPGCPS
jgi:hypothetical protein